MKTKNQSFKLLMAATVGTAALVAPVAAQAANSESVEVFEDISLNVAMDSYYLLDDYFSGKGNTYTFTAKDIVGNDVITLKGETGPNNEPAIKISTVSKGVSSVKVTATDTSGKSQSKSFLVGVETEVESYGVIEKKEINSFDMALNEEPTKVDLRDHFYAETGGALLYDVHVEGNKENVSVTDGVITFNPTKEGMSTVNITVKNDESTKVKTIYFGVGEETGINGGEKPGTENGGEKPGTENGGDKPGTENGGDKPGTENGGDKPGTENGGDKPGTGNSGDKPGTENGKGESGKLGQNDGDSKKPTLTEQEKKDKLTKFEAEEKAKEKARENAEANKNKSMLPQTGTETAAATGAIGALFLAMAAAVGLKRKKK